MSSPSSSQGNLAGHCRLWHLGAGDHQSLHSSRGLIWPGPGPGCMELSGFVFSPHRAPVPTKITALKCSRQSRKKKHQGNAGAGIRRGRRLVMRSGLCVLGRLIRWLSLIRDWPGTVQGGTIGVPGTQWEGNYVLARTQREEAST